MKRLEYRIQGFKSCLLRSWNLWQIQAYFLSGLVMKTQNHRWIIIAKGDIKFQISNEILSQHTKIAFISVLAFSHTDPSLHFHDEVLFKYSTAAELRRIQNPVKTFVMEVFAKSYILTCFWMRSRCIESFYSSSQCYQKSCFNSLSGIEIWRRKRR